MGFVINHVSNIAQFRAKDLRVNGINISRSCIESVSV